MSGGTFLTHTVNLSPRSVRVSAHLWFVRRCWLAVGYLINKQWCPDSSALHWRRTPISCGQWQCHHDSVSDKDNNKGNKESVWL